MPVQHALMRISWLLLVAQLCGCSSPTQRMDDRATDFGYRKLVVPGEGFSHVAYFKEGRSTTGALHVYLEGDGTPWARKRVAASDPTPRTPLMLELMALDPVPSLYLGRPCYHGLNNAKACTPDLWTNRRYSEAVVASMSAALDRLTVDYQALVLMGYSGGGTLAMLLAERQPKTKALISVAANLDTERWTELHKQQPLSGSLNPATRIPLPLRITQMHYAGGKDDNVPPSLVHDAISQQQGATFKVYPNQDHSCCWRDVWPEILGELMAD
ncbi:MAG: dienelactone hydrolase family protein [Sideroxyarcus sp.]|nr:dienelactone hydrolase family protein [Sideroxyarcus sp.]